MIQKPLIRKCVFLAAALNLLLSPYFIVGIPVILRITMNSPDTLYGIGMGIVEVGTILGALSIGLFAKRMQMNTLYRWIAWIAVLLIPVAILLSPIAEGLGFYSVLVLFFLFIIPMVMVTIIVSIFVITHVQRETPNALLGKVMAIIMMV
ncbi:MAG: MFS transporter, partial [Clostridiales Family XIII bacterium]|nr:MFS transporter [Clostridiales Family XIII bacterium]